MFWGPVGVVALQPTTQNSPMETESSASGSVPTAWIDSLIEGGASRSPCFPYPTTVEAANNEHKDIAYPSVEW